MIVYIHGFLGSHKDWRFLYEILPGPYQTLSSPESIQKPVTLIGYSLGGRLALDFAARHPHLIENLIILSAHPGIDDPKERTKRLKQDMQWCNFIDEKGIFAFVEKWYRQPIFASFRQHPSFSNAFKRRLQNQVEDVKKILQTFSPAILPSRWKEIKNFPFNSLFLFGEHDIKYRLIQNKLAHLGVETDLIPNSGHVIHLENPLICAQKIEKFLCRL